MSEKLPNINLLPAYEHQSKLGYILFVGFIVLTLLGFAFVGVDYFISKKSLENAQSKHMDRTTEVDTLNGKLVALQNEMNQESLEESVFFVEYNDVPTSVLIKELVDLLPDTGYIREYYYTPLYATVINDFDTYVDIADYTRELTTSPYITDTMVYEINEIQQISEEIVVDEYDFVDIMPRYEAVFSLAVNRVKVKEGVDADE